MSRSEAWGTGLASAEARAGSVAAIITRAQAEFIGSTDRLHAFALLIDETAELVGAAGGLLHEVTLGRVDRGLGAEPTEFVEVVHDVAGNADSSVGAPTDLMRHFHAVAATRTPTIVDTTDDAGAPASLLIAPIEHEGGLIGMLTLIGGPGSIRPDDVEVLRPVYTLLAQLLEVWRTTRLRRQDQQSIARLSQVAQQMRNGMVITDATGRIEWVNDAFVRDVGIPAAEVLGRMPVELYARIDVDAVDAPELPELLSRGEPFAGEFRLIDREDGTEMWFEIAATHFINGEGLPEGLMIMTNDISERRRIERMKDDFVSTVSHELRTPLTSITGALSLLNSGIRGALSEPLEEMVSIAHRNSRRLTRLIDDLLDLDKLAAGKLRIDLEVRPVMELVDEACVENQVYADGYGVRIECTTRAEQAHVEVDPQRLQQVLRNLLSNAAKFSKPGDVVEVQVTASDRLVQVHVVDHGVGIRESFQPHVFTKFRQDERSERKAVGTGLGLAISLDLVDRMGGTLGFVSTEGVGSTFTVTLPRCQPKGR